MNFFKLLDVPETFDLDSKELHKKYLELQAKYHPDKANNIEGKNNFIILSSDINKAYETLNNDLTRAEHLLQLKNVDISKVKLSPQQLEVVIFNQEKLEKILNISELEEIYNNKIKDRVELINCLKQAFLNDDIQSILDLTISLRYLTKLLGDIKLKMDYANSRNQ